MKASFSGDFSEYLDFSKISDVDFDYQAAFAELGIDEEEMRSCGFFGNQGRDPCYQQDQPRDDYKYGFTDSDFIYFIATVDPIEFTVIMTVIAILFTEQFNLEELFVLSRFFTSFRDAIDIIMNQRISLRLVCDAWTNEAEEKEEEEEDEELDADELREQLAALNRKYDHLHGRMQQYESTGYAPMVHPLNPETDLSLEDQSIDSLLETPH